MKLIMNNYYAFILFYIVMIEYENNTSSIKLRRGQKGRIANSHFMFGLDHK